MVGYIFYVCVFTQQVTNTHLCGTPVWAAAAPGESCSPLRSFFYWVWFQSVSADLPESGQPDHAGSQSAPVEPLEHAVGQLI